MRKIKFLAIIPARAGSKRLPGKNIKEFGGKPLINWTIECATSVVDIDEVVVSTDCLEIARVATEAGAIVPFLRPASLGTDSSTSYDVIKNIIDSYDDAGVDVENIILLQPTSPLRTEESLKGAIKTFQEKSAGSLIAVTKSDHPSHIYGELGKGGCLAKMSSNIANAEKKHKAQTYRINGAIYIFNKVLLLKKKTLFFKERAFSYIMPKIESVDIDTIEDFVAAEALLKYKIDCMVY